MKKDSNITEDALFRCSAGWCEFFSIAVWDWRPNGKVEYNFAIIAEPRGIMDRIKKGFEVMFKGTTYMREIILTDKDVKEIKRILNKK